MLEGKLKIEDLAIISSTSVSTPICVWQLSVLNLDLSRRQPSKQFYVLYDSRTKRNMSCANQKANHFQFPKE